MAAVALERSAGAARDALHSLLAGDAQLASETLHFALGQSPPPPDLAIACLLCDLGLCSLHSGRPAEAAEAIRHSLALLPPIDVASVRLVDTSDAWIPLSRAQMHLNLCEALLVQGQLVQMVHEAREAIFLAQLAIPHCNTAPRNDTSDPVPTQGATPRLFAARWLHPHPQYEAVLGALAAPEALALAWLWCAIAQEGLGSYQEALRCYNRAMGVAQIDRKAALAMSEQLKKKVALTELVAFGTEETTGLTGQRVEASDFRGGVPYGTSIEGMIWRESAKIAHGRLLNSAVSEPRLGLGRRRTIGEGKRSISGSIVRKIPGGLSAGLWSHTPTDVFGPPKAKPAAKTLLSQPASPSPRGPGVASHTQPTASTCAAWNSGEGLAGLEERDEHARPKPRMPPPLPPSRGGTGGGRNRCSQMVLQQPHLSRPSSASRQTSSATGLHRAVRPSSALPCTQTASSASLRTSRSTLAAKQMRMGGAIASTSVSESRSLADSAGTKGAFGVYLLSHSEHLRHICQRDARIQADSRRAARASRLEAARRAAQTAALALEAAAASALRKQAQQLLPAEDVVDSMMRAAAADLRRAHATNERRKRRALALARRGLERELEVALRRLTRVLAGAIDGRGVRLSAARAAIRGLEALRRREQRDGSVRRGRCLASVLWVLQHKGVDELDVALRMLEWLLQNFDDPPNATLITNDAEEEGASGEAEVEPDSEAGSAMDEEEEEAERTALVDETETAQPYFPKSPKVDRPPQPIQIPAARKAAAERLLRRLAQEEIESKQEGRLRLAMELHVEPPQSLLPSLQEIKYPPSKVDEAPQMPPLPSPTPLEVRRAVDAQKRQLERADAEAVEAASRAEAAALIQSDRDARTTKWKAAAAKRASAAAVTAAARASHQKKAEVFLRNEHWRREEEARRAFAVGQAAHYWAQLEARVQALANLVERERVVHARQAETKAQREHERREEEARELEERRAATAARMKPPDVRGGDHCSASVSLLAFEFSSHSALDGPPRANVALRIFPRALAGPPAAPVRYEYTTSDAGCAPPTLELQKRAPTVRFAPTREVVSLLDEVWASFSLFARPPSTAGETSRDRDSRQASQFATSSSPSGIYDTSEEGFEIGFGKLQPSEHSRGELEAMVSSAQRRRDELTLEAATAEQRVRSARELIAWSADEKEARRQLQQELLLADELQLRAAEAAGEAAALAARLDQASRPSSNAAPQGLFKERPPPFSISPYGLLVDGGEVAVSELELVLEAFGSAYLHPSARIELLQTLETQAALRICNVSDNEEAEGVVCFPHFFRELVQRLAMPCRSVENEHQREALSQPIEVDLEELTAPLHPQALASLHAAFRLFDTFGTGHVGREELDLVLIALHSHADAAELDALVSLLAPPELAEPVVAFHQFVERLIASLGGEVTATFNVRDSESLLAKRLAQLWPDVGDIGGVDAAIEKGGIPALLSAVQMSTIYSAFTSFASWSESKGRPGVVVPHILEDEVPLVLRALEIEAEADAFKPALCAALHVPAGHEDPTSLPIDFDTFCAVYSSVLIGCTVEASAHETLINEESLSSHEKDLEDHSSPVVSPKATMDARGLSSMLALREAFLSFADAHETVSADEMELVVKAIGVHRPERELEVAWKKMEIDRHNPARLPFKAIHDFLGILGVELALLAPTSEHEALRPILNS